jgi:hypothetical protein
MSLARRFNAGIRFLPTCFRRVATIEFELVSSVGYATRTLRLNPHPLLIPVQPGTRPSTMPVVLRASIGMETRDPPFVRGRVLALMEYELSSWKGLLAKVTCGNCAG